MKPRARLDIGQWPPYARWLTCMWVILLFYGEVGSFWLTSISCSAELKLGDSLRRIAVIADPQLTDFYSYKQETGVLLSLTEFYSDLYMRRAYRFGVGPLVVDKVLFLGDLFDGGRLLDDRQYRQHVDRFRTIFHDWTTGDDRFIFVAGNHDIGLGPYFSKNAASRFEKHFGPRHRSLEVCNHRLVLLDGVSLTHRDYRTVTPEQSIETQQMLDFVATEMRTQYDGNVIVISHIPLWRPSGVPCDESKYKRYKVDPISLAGGVSYQNTLNARISQQILVALKPALILSGDDHDSCYFKHKLPTGMSFPEFTLPTFSWLQGVRHPAFLVLTLKGCDAGTPANHEVALCSLPDQLAIYMCYIAAFVLYIIVGSIHHFAGGGVLFLMKRGATKKYTPLGVQEEYASPKRAHFEQEQYPKTNNLRYRRSSSFDEETIMNIPLDEDEEYLEPNHKQRKAHSPKPILLLHDVARLLSIGLPFYLVLLIFA